MAAWSPARSPAPLPQPLSAGLAHQSTGAGPIPVRRSGAGRSLRPCDLSCCSSNMMHNMMPAAAPAEVKPLSLTPAPASRHSNLTTAALRVAYQGVPGAYSEMAAEKAYPDCCPVPCNQFDDAFLAVEQWLVERAVLPIENSLGGSIHRNYDLLLRHRLHIVGEVQLPVTHCLLALPGSKISDLTRVMSHPQALAQTEMTLSRLGSMVREAVDDTAGAAQMVARDRLEGVGAVASSRAAEIYNLEILAEGIQDDVDNVTRFLVLAREPILPTNNLPFKTSIVFTLEKGPGVLFKALSVFALRDINLTKIESRPQRDKPLLQQQMSTQQAAPNHPEATSDPSTAFLIDGVLSATSSAKNGNGGNGTRPVQGNGSGPQAQNEQAAASLPGDGTAPAPSVMGCYQSFDYLFYIDFQASLAERNAQNALRHLQEFAPFLRVLGSYPMDITI